VIYIHAEREFNTHLKNSTGGKEDSKLERPSILLHLHKFHVKHQVHNCKERWWHGKATVKSRQRPGKIQKD
jgi:hypothetical protein